MTEEVHKDVVLIVETSVVPDRLEHDFMDVYRGAGVAGQPIKAKCYSNGARSAIVELHATCSIQWRWLGGHQVGSSLVVVVVHRSRRCTGDQNQENDTRDDGFQIHSDLKERRRNVA